MSVLSLGFIRLFFVRKNVISLEEAAKALTEKKNSNKMKTKVRFGGDYVKNF